MTTQPLLHSPRSFFSRFGRHPLWLPFVLMLLTAGMLPAQSSLSGSLHLHVQNTSGADVGGANVKVTRTGSTVVLEATSNPDGDATFSSLTDGDYVVDVTREGFAEVNQHVTLNDGKVVDVNVRLGIAAVEQSVSVSAEMDAYQPSVNVSTSRLNVDPQQLPETIKVISRQLLDEQQILRVGDVTQNIAGVTRSPGLGQLEDQWSIRGFESIGNLFFKDGFRDNASLLRDTANLEQIEVLKGGAAAEYGRGDPSGIVNMITKKPLDQTIVALHGYAGSYDTFRFAPDVTGPLTRSHKFLYRYNMALERGNSYRKFIETDREFFAPAFTWKPTSTTTIDLQSEYLQSAVPYDRGTVAINNQFGTVPIDNYYGQPGIGVNVRSFRVALTGTQQLPKNWIVDVAGANGFAALKGQGVQINSISTDGTTGMRQNTFRNYRDPFWYLRSDATGSFHLLHLEHQLVAGTDNGSDSVKSGDQNRSTGLTPINLQNPVYTVPLAPITFKTRIIKRSKFVSGFATDFISLPGNFRLMLGGRIDRYRLTSVDTLATPIKTQEYRDLVPTSRVGLSWLPTPSLTLFANTAQSFNPQLGTDFYGKLFQPERGRQYEAGVKGQLPHSRLNASVAIFQIRKTNVLTADPMISPNPTTGEPSHIGYQVATGEQQSRGVEFEVSGAATPHWRYSANYAHLHAEILKDSTFIPGVQLINIPSDAGALWTMYDFHAAKLRGLTVGGGLVAAGARPLTQTNTAWLPAYGRLDLSAIYAVRRYTMNFKVENATNQAYYPSAFGNNVMIATGAPVNYRFGIDIRLMNGR